MNLLKIVPVLGICASLAGCATFGDTGIRIDKTLMPGGYGAVVRTEATALTPGATCVVTAAQTMSCVGGNGIVGNIVDAAGNIISSAVSLPPIAVAISSAGANANSDM